MNLHQVGSAIILVATGGTITTCGDFKVHTFTGPGTFTVCSVASNACAGSQSVDYLVVAGAGGGAGSRSWWLWLVVEVQVVLELSKCCYWGLPYTASPL